VRAGGRRAQHQPRGALRRRPKAALASRRAEIDGSADPADHNRDPPPPRRR